MKGDEGKERGVLTWHPNMWGPCGSHADSAATSDKIGVKTTEGQQGLWVKFGPEQCISRRLPPTAATSLGVAGGEMIPSSRHSWNPVSDSYHSAT
uniref:Uncharacterized protein n=1 Tax=Oryza meridionalis TaxID=40149 RepID=A0A0E0E2W2_9ORYZ